MYHPLLRTCRAFQPDVLVADMTTLAAHDVAEELKLPLALLGSMPLSLALDFTGVHVSGCVRSATAAAAAAAVTLGDQSALRAARLAATCIHTQTQPWPFPSALP